jgi:hypothetical protein
MEHLALIKRWYYRGSRMGEIFLADDKGALPMRRIVRGIGRVLRGEAAEVDASLQPQFDKEASQTRPSVADAFSGQAPTE